MSKFIPKTAVLMVTYNRANILAYSLKKMDQSYMRVQFDIYVVDNNSTDYTKTVVSQFKQTHYLKENKNYFVSKGLNDGFHKFNLSQKYEYVILIANDVLVDKRTFFELVSFMQQHPDVGLSGPSHYDYNSRLIRTYGLSINSVTSLLVNYLDPMQITGINHFSSCYIVRTSLFKKIGGFDDLLYPMIFEEPDLGEKILKEGSKIKPCIKAKIWHPIVFDEKKSQGTPVREDRLYSNAPKTYLFFRNRIIYMSIHTTFINFLLFYFIFNPLILLYYLPKIAFGNLLLVVYGIIDGTIFALTKNRNYIGAKNPALIYES